MCLLALGLLYFSQAVVLLVSLTLSCGVLKADSLVWNLQPPTINMRLFATHILLCLFLSLHLLAVFPAYIELVILNYILGFVII